MDIKNEALQTLEKTLNSTPKTGFPTQVFPLAVQQLIDNAESTVNFPRDFLSAGILSTCATAIGNSASLDTGGWEAKPILWLAIIGEPGTRKTHPLNFAVKPLENQDSISYEIYQSELSEWQGADGRKPTYSKFILSDFTPEKLGQALQYNAKGVLLFNDELMRWINSFDRYQKGGEQQLYLNLWNGGIFTVDRKTAEPVRVENANANILGGMQPEILKGISANGRDKDGFLDRFLFVYPKAIAAPKYTGKGIETWLKDSYHKLVNNLLTIPETTLTPCPEAIQEYMVWQNQKVVLCNDDNLERRIQAKMETYVWRLALVLEMMHQGVKCEFSQTLTAQSIRNAITLAEYFRENAYTVNEKLVSSSPLDALSAKQKEVYHALPHSFKRVDVLAWAMEEFKVHERNLDRMLSNARLFQNYRTNKELKQGEYIKKA